MAQFYAEIQGNRGEATRMGSKSSGINGHIRGWHVGAKVSCYYDEESDRDIVRVHQTRGSSGYSASTLISEFCEFEGKNEPCDYCEHCFNRFKCFTEKK